MTLQGKSVSTVGLLQLRNFFFFFFAPPYSKWLQRVTTLRTFYSFLEEDGSEFPDSVSNGKEGDEVYPSSGPSFSGDESEYSS